MSEMQTPVRPFVRDGKLVCPKCRQEKMPLERVCCFNCGTEFISEPWCCQSCGRENKYLSEKCSYCGTPSNFVVDAPPEIVTPPVASNELHRKAAAYGQSTRRKATNSIKTAPNTKAAAVGILLFVFSFMHICSLNYSIAELLCKDLWYECSYFDAPILCVIELVFAAMLIIIGIMFVVARIRQVNRDYKGLTLEKTARLFLFFVYTIYALLLLLIPGDTLVDGMRDFKGLYAGVVRTYLVFPFCFACVILFSYFSMGTYILQWGKKEYFPFNNPKDKRWHIID